MTQASPPPGSQRLAPGEGVLTLLSCQVQSSKSALEQYMGRWPMVMIHGRTARFLLAFCREGLRVRGRGAVLEERVGRHIPGDIQRLPGGRSPASETVSLPGGGHNGGRNIPRWRRR